MCSTIGLMATASTAGHGGSHAGPAVDATGEAVVLCSLYHLVLPCGRWLHVTPHGARVPNHPAVPSDGVLGTTSPPARLKRKLDARHDAPSESSSLSCTYMSRRRRGRAASNDALCLSGRRDGLSSCTLRRCWSAGDVDRVCWDDAPRASAETLGGGRGSAAAPDVASWQQTGSMSACQQYHSGHARAVLQRHTVELLPVGCVGMDCAELRDRSIRCLGWDGLSQPAEELIGALQAACEGLDVSFADKGGQLALPPRGRRCGACVVVAVWVIRTSPGRHAIGLKRVSGDTFHFHVFYRQLREAMAPITGWTGDCKTGDCNAPRGSYAQHVQPGVCPPPCSVLSTEFGLRCHPAQSDGASQLPVAGRLRG